MYEYVVVLEGAEIGIEYHHCRYCAVLLVLSCESKEVEIWGIVSNLFHYYFSLKADTHDDTSKH